MVKHDSAIWKYFAKTRNEDCKYLKAKCIYCGMEYITNAKRMRKHILQCTLSPADVKQDVVNIIKCDPYEKSRVKKRLKKPIDFKENITQEPTSPKRLKKKSFENSLRVPTTEIWKYFRRKKTTKSKYLKAICTFCGLEYITNAARMRRHILNCDKAPARVRRKAQELIRKYGSMGKKWRSKTMDVCKDKSTVTEEEKLILDNLLRSALTTSGVPFGLVENRYFKDFINVLRPSYQLPSLKALTSFKTEIIYETSGRDCRDC